MTNTSIAALVILAGLSPAPAQSSEEGAGRTHAVSLDLGYVGPNVWAGWRTSEGPVLQPTAAYSLGDPLLGSFEAGMYCNMYGSQKDRIRESTGGYRSGYNSLALGTVDEFQLFGGWERSWGNFTLSAAYWHLAYTWNDNRLEWFGKFSSGELTVAPAYALGPFTFYTEQNMVVVANSRGDTVEVKQDSTGNTPSFDLNRRTTDLGSYHAVYGMGWAHEAGPMGLDLGLKTEWATYKFIKPWIWDGDIKNHHPSGFYHVTFTAGTSYSPTPWVTLSANYGYQHMLNKWIDLDKKYKGSVTHAGIHANFHVDL